MQLFWWVIHLSAQACAAIRLPMRADQLLNWLLNIQRDKEAKPYDLASTMLAIATLHGNWLIGTAAQDGALLREALDLLERADQSQTVLAGLLWQKLGDVLTSESKMAIAIFAYETAVAILVPSQPCLLNKAKLLTDLANLYAGTEGNEIRVDSLRREADFYFEAHLDMNRHMPPPP